MDGKKHILFYIDFSFKFNRFFFKALSHASSKGHLKCVHKLLKLGADPSIYTYDYLYPFDLAQDSGFPDVTSLFLNCN